MLDLNTLSLPDLFAHLTADGRLTSLLHLAREEDLDEAGDVTTSLLPHRDQPTQATMSTREAGVVCGLAAIDTLLDVFEADVAVELHSYDGASVELGMTLASLRGPLREIVRVERTMLNLIGRLSGVATLTRRYVEAASIGNAAICDTRKTMPGWRHLEKYATRCGGATLHRLGLHDAVLLKDNHLAALQPRDFARRVGEMAEAARQRFDLRFFEVEVDTLEQFDALLDLPDDYIDYVLLDNMSNEMMAQAVERRDAAGRRVQLEASGGITLERVGTISGLGVDRISVGALTHSAGTLDVGFDIATEQ